MASDYAKELVKRWRALAGGRSTWLSHWDDLAKVQLPRRLGFATATVEGDKRTETLYDGTPMQAARGLANAIAGLMRPDGQDWFFIKPVDDALENSDEVKDWLANAEQDLRAALFNPKARFRQAMGECDLDLVVFGTAVVFAGETPDLGRLIHQSIHLKDAVVVFGESGDPDGLFISHRYTLRNAAQKFKEENLSEESRKKIAEKQIDDKIEVLHAILPRKEGRKDALLAKNLPYADIWLEVEACHEIQVGGFHEFPCIVPRFDTSSGEDYGRSPGMIALPDSNTAQAMGETLLIAGQRAASPPLLVPNDGAFNPINVVPDGLAYYDADLARDMGRIPIEALKSGENIPLTREMQTDIREQIRTAFYRNVFNLPVDGPQMTAEEIRARKEEFIREIGPVFGRLETDTAPLIERDFKIMLRAGAFAPIPEALLGSSVRFEYESPVKRIKEQIELAIAQGLIVEAMGLAQAGFPDGMDRINLDAYFKYKLKVNNLPPSLFLTDDQVFKKQQARAQQAQAAQEAAMLNEGANTMANVMKAVPQQQAAA